MKLKNYLNAQSIINPKSLTVIGMLIAMSVALNFFTTVFIAADFKLISYAYLPNAVISILYGPVAGVTAAFISDFLGYIVKPAGPYFIGYAITLMVQCFIYAVFLYNTHFSVWAVCVARLLVVVIAFFGLNSIWNSIVYGTYVGDYFTSARLIKNLINFPIDCFLITFFGKLALTLEKKQKFNLKSLVSLK